MCFHVYGAISLRPLNCLYGFIRVLSYPSIDEVDQKFRPRGYKTFPCSTQLSTTFQLLIKSNILRSENVSCFKSLRFGIYYANEC